MAREERAGGGSSIRVGSGRKKGKITQQCLIFYNQIKVKWTKLRRKGREPGMQGRGNGPVPPNITPRPPNPEQPYFSFESVAPIIFSAEQILVYKYYQGQTCSLYCLKIIISMRLTFNLQIGQGIIIIMIPLKKDWTKRKAL